MTSPKLKFFPGHSIWLLILLWLFPFVTPQSLAAQDTVLQPEGVCAACVNSLTCAVVTESGLWSTGCAVRNGECEEDFGYCYIHPKNAAADLGIATDDFLLLDGPEGRLAFAPVGESRYALWDCGGNLVRLVSRQNDGSLRDLSVSKFARRYKYQRIVAEFRPHSA